MAASTRVTRKSYNVKFTVIIDVLTGNFMLPLLIIIIIIQGILNTPSLQQKLNYINIYNQRTLRKSMLTSIV